MKVLVTGASGFFGSHVAEELAGQGFDVRVLVRPDARERPTPAPLAAATLPPSEGEGHGVS